MALWIDSRLLDADAGLLGTVLLLDSAFWAASCDLSFIIHNAPEASLFTDSSSEDAANFSKTVVSEYGLLVTLILMITTIVVFYLLFY